MFLHEIELTGIQALQRSLRCPLLDSYFLAWNYIDSTLFFCMGFVALFWFFISRRIGIRLLYLFVLSSILNAALKHYFQLPRPCHIDPHVGLLVFSSPGFPSGAAQTAVIVAGVIWIETKKKCYRYLGLLFSLNLCFSRLYLGAHFFSDILGGILVGCFLLIIYSYLFPWIEKKQTPRLILFSLILLALSQFKFPLQTGVALGVAMGLLLQKKTHLQERWYLQALEAGVGLTAFFLFLEMKSLYPDMKFFFALTAGFCFSSCSLPIRSLCSKEPPKP